MNDLKLSDNIIRYNIPINYEEDINRTSLVLLVELMGNKFICNRNSDEYISCIKNKEKGLNSIRNSPKKIWTVWMDESLEKAKNIYNKICSDNITEEDIKQIKNLIERFNNCAKSFYTDTDKLSLYPIESELIYNNLKTISNIFKFYYEQYTNK